MTSEILYFQSASLKLVNSLPWSLSKPSVKSPSPIEGDVDEELDDGHEDAIDGDLRAVPQYKILLSCTQLVSDARLRTSSRGHR